MKKLLIGILSLAIVGTVGAVSVSALAPFGGRQWVDENEDGVCDNLVSVQSTGYVDADGNGVCDNWDGTGNGAGLGSQNRGKGNGAGYVDADGDGVCDNWDGTGNGAGLGNQNRGEGNRMGRGTGNGAGRGNGRGAGYVDADGDGVCDNYLVKG